MRCPDCGRFVAPDGSAWALKCACPAPCWRCGDTHAPGGGCGETEPAAGPADRVPHPCGKCPQDRQMDCAFSRGMPDCDALRRWLAGVDMAALVEAVRADRVVGRGTCSRIDECLEDADLRRELALAGCGTAPEAVKWARADERLFLEQGTNQRWGEDGDPQLAAMREFEAADRDNPVR